MYISEIKGVQGNVPLTGIQNALLRGLIQTVDKVTKRVMKRWQESIQEQSKQNKVSDIANQNRKYPRV